MTRTLGRALARAVFVDSLRARAARRLGGAGPSRRRRRVHDRDRARHVGARRRRPAPVDAPRRHRTLGRHRPERRAATPSRPNRRPTRLAWEQTDGPADRTSSATRRLARPPLHDAAAFDRSDRRRDARPHVLRSSGMARAFEGRLLPPHDRRRRSPCRRHRHRKPRCRTWPAKLVSGYRARPSSFTTASTIRASRPRPPPTKATDARCSPATGSHARTSRSRARSNRARTYPRSCAPSPGSPPRIPTCNSSSRAATAGASTRRAPRSRRAASRPASSDPVMSTTPRSAALFRRAEVIAYPSLVEGFGMPALEALASGTPLVTTSGSALEEIVGDAGAARSARRRRRPRPRAGHRARRSRRSRPGSAPTDRHAPRRSRGNVRSRRTSTCTTARFVTTPATPPFTDEGTRHRRDRLRRSPPARPSPRMRRRRRRARRRERRVRHHRSRHGARHLRTRPARGRLPPRGLVGRRRVVARSRPRACA